MALQITATELSGQSPAFVQVVVTGLSGGDVYSVFGMADGHAWAVQGGTGISDGSQLVLIDSRCPWGGPVTYRVQVGDTYADSDPFALSDPGVEVVLQDLTGSRVVPVEVATLTDPKSLPARSVLFRVAGRRAPVHRHDVRDSARGPLVVETSSAAATRELAALLADGAPIVRRQRLGLRDIEPVQILAVGDASTELVGAMGDLRTWSLPWTQVDDPEPDTVLVMWGWDDVDTVYSAAEWSTFDAEWSGRDWNEFDREDWGARL